MDGDTGTELATITPAATPELIPAFTGQVPGDLRQAIRQAVDAWLLRTPSPHTRRAYRLDLDQFLAASGIEPDAWERLAAIRPPLAAAAGDPAPVLEGGPAR